MQRCRQFQAEAQIVLFRFRTSNNREAHAKPTMRLSFKRFKVSIFEIQSLTFEPKAIGNTLNPASRSVPTF